MSRPFRPNYQSHKQVESYQIRAGEVREDRSAKWALSNGEIVETSPAFVANRVPEEGDYLVRYAADEDHPDGYVSWSPRAPFEAGNTAISDEPVMDFGEAIRALKAGKRVAREGWNGRAMWLALSGPLEGRTIAADAFWSPNNVAYARQRGGEATVLPCITMKTADGAILMGWLASQTDMLADDWMVVGAEPASSEAAIQHHASAR